MESKAAFNWCFIGAGTLANIVAKKILPSGRHRIAAVYTRNAQKCREFAGKYGGTAYSSAEAAISAPDVNGVYIVTPHTSHYEYAKSALSMGKPVLCEKPITVTAPDAIELFALAAEKGVYLAEAMWTWFSPVARKVKQWYDAGELGALYHAEARYHIDSRRYTARCTDPDLAGGALLDVGIYPITYLYRLFGKPIEVRCTGRLEGGIDLCEDVTMSFSNGLTCTASVSMCDFKGLEKIHLEGGKGRIKHCGTRRTAFRSYYESECLLTVPHEPPPPAPTGPFERCGGCPYPDQGFICWNRDSETCLRTEVARIMERDKLVGFSG